MINEESPRLEERLKDSNENMPSRQRNIDDRREQIKKTLCRTSLNKERTNGAERSRRTKTVVFIAREVSVTKSLLWQIL